VPSPGQETRRYLFTVGDDWQSINRFAGADLSVMTAFRDWFGPSEYLRLEQTFRCPQVLCDISSQFVSKNPHQLSKQVRSMTPQQGAVIEAFQVDQKEKLADAIDTFIMSLANDIAAGVIPPGRNGRISVYILGRYNADRQYLPGREHRYNTWLDVSFLTIHRAKGSEADYVILPEMLTQLKGRSFPSTRGDDPVLKLAMPEGDNFPDSEERRLFYVALTRARRRVTLFTVKGSTLVFYMNCATTASFPLPTSMAKRSPRSAAPPAGKVLLFSAAGPTVSSALF
jgi:DNA helicase-4